jgi:hypothetical protein
VVIIQLNVDIVDLVKILFFIFLFWSAVLVIIFIYINSDIYFYKFSVYARDFYYIDLHLFNIIIGFKIQIIEGGEFSEREHSNRDRAINHIVDTISGVQISEVGNPAEENIHNLEDLEYDLYG